MVLPRSRPKVTITELANETSVLNQTVMKSRQSRIRPILLHRTKTLRFFSGVDAALHLHHRLRGQPGQELVEDQHALAGLSELLPWL